MAGVAAGDDTIFHNYFFVHNILNVNTLCGRTTNYKRKQNDIMSNIKKILTTLYHRLCDCH